MADEFISFYGKNILNESTLINGVKDFLKWCKNNNISMAVCTNKTEYLAVDLLKKLEFMTTLSMLLDIILLNIANLIQGI